MRINDDNYVKQMKLRNQKALVYFIDHYGWIIKTIVHKKLNNNREMQEECINDTFLAIWNNVSRYDENKAEFIFSEDGHELIECIIHKKHFIHIMTNIMTDAMPILKNVIVNRAKQLRFMKTEEFIIYAHFRNGVEALPSLLRRKYRVDKIPKDNSFIQLFISDFQSF